MNTFITNDSIVKKIWGTTDITLFIFAGAAAEFALNKQVDWLYFTGRLPADPIGRLFSTVNYAQRIIFSDQENAVAAVTQINRIHQAVEQARGQRITESGYKDVLYMLIHYSIAAFELLDRKLLQTEKDEVVSTFARIGESMHISNLPHSYGTWLPLYKVHQNENLENGRLTRHLFGQYRKHLGGFRYLVLIEVQKMLVSSHVNRLLRLGRARTVALVRVYRLVRKSKLSKRLIIAMVPARFRAQLRSMERVNAVGITN